MIYYTSDLHFGHGKVADIRGFSSTDAHDEAVARYWNRTVRDDDTVWVLGDLSIHEGRLDETLGKIADLNGIKHLVFGNHDPGHPMRSKAHKCHWRYLEVFDTVQAYATRKTNGKRFFLSHFPYEGDHTEVDRHPEVRLRDEGIPIVHGHMHTKHQITVTSKGTPQVHVGLDAWNLTPVSEELVLAVFRVQELKGVLGELKGILEEVA